MGNHQNSMLGLFICVSILIQQGCANPTSSSLNEVITKLNLISDEHEHIMKLLQEMTGNKVGDITSETEQQCGKPSKLTEDIAETLKYLKDKLDMADGKKMLEGSGATYVRWGRTECPNVNGTVKVYDGFAGGDWYGHQGGPTQLLCLPKDPIWGKYIDTYTGHAFVYGAEFSPTKAQSEEIFGRNLGNHNVPCVVCQSIGRPAVLRIPGRTECYPSWRKEYNGYLMGGHHGHSKSTDYTCVDAEPEVVQGKGAYEKGHFLYFVEANCGEGSLPCPPYVHAREMTCVICTK